MKGGRHLALTFTLHAAGHGVDGGDGPGETKPLFLQLALLPSGALLDDFDHSILLQELSVKCANPKHMEDPIRSETQIQRSRQYLTRTRTDVYLFSIS